MAHDRRRLEHDTTIMTQQGRHVLLPNNFIHCNCYVVDEQSSRLTVQDHRDTEKAGDGGTDQPDASGPSSAHWSPVHHQYRDDVGGNLERSRQERVEVDVAVQRPGVECQRVVDEAARRPEVPRVAWRRQVQLLYRFGDILVLTPSSCR